MRGEKMEDLVSVQLITNLNTERYELLKPIPVTIEYDGKESYVLGKDCTNFPILCGYGKNNMEAIENMLDELIEKFVNLHAIPDDKLGPTLVMEKNLLLQLIRAKQTSYYT